MWSGFVKSLTKDLGEFASVLTADTQRIVEGDGAGAAAQSATGRILAGDEASPEATVFPLDDAEIDALQCDVLTFSAPLTVDEENEAHRLNASLCDAERLLSVNETIRDQYAYLVTQKTQQSPPRATNQSETDTERGVTHEDFFKRYFTRLLRLRRTSSRIRRQQQNTSTAANDGTVLSDWDSSPSGTKAASAGAASTGGDALSSAERSAYEKKIQDLERLVAALGSQVGHLQSENVRLQRELAASRGGSGAPPAAVLSPDGRAPSVGSHAPASAAKTDSAPLDDDDWATVS